MIVEVQGIGFWTRVRLPSTPLNHKYQNPGSNVKFSVYKNVFGIIYELGDTDDHKMYAMTFGGIHNYILDEYKLDVSKSSIAAVKVKCGADKLEIGAGKVIPKLKSEKEIAVLEAFKAFGIV